jgi:MFS family permease
MTGVSVTRSSLIVLIPLAFSAIVHLWNPFGFPSIHNDEGHYMRRNMQVLEGAGPQESYATYASPFDHPYFGQTFLAGVLSTIGYPELSAPSSTNFVDIVQSIEKLYTIPRIIMGCLSVVDTFLIYKVCERRYNRRLALIAAILFAVMPIGWMSKRIVLDSIMLPFILLAIYFALHRGSEKASLSASFPNRALIKNPKSRIITVLLSGIFLGLAIFTKIPAFTFIPLAGFLVLTNSNRSFKLLGIWFIPVLLIPMLWPLFNFLNGNFETWMEGVFWQVGREGRGMLRSIIPVFHSDPILFLLGFVGIVYAASRKDLFPIMWLVPFVLFHYFVPFIQHFHWLPLVPLLCIFGGYLIVQLLDFICRDILRRQHRNLGHFKRASRYTPLAIIVSVLAFFGFISSVALINMNVNSTLFEVNAHIVQLLLPYNDTYFGDQDEKPLVMGSGWTQILTWIPEHIYDVSHSFRTFTSKNLELANQSSFVILLVDARDKERYAIMEELSPKDLTLYRYYNGTEVVFETNDKSDVVRYDVEKYPYGSLRENHAIRNGDWIEIRIKEID